MKLHVLVSHNEDEAVLDGISGQLHALATFFAQQMLPYPMDRVLELMWVIFLCPSIKYHLLKCRRSILMSLKFVNLFLNVVCKTAKHVNTCCQGNGVPRSCEFALISERCCCY
jgi:hypothetical protein